MKKTLLFFPLLAAFFFMPACSDKSDMSGGTAHVEVRLTDDPGDYDAVYIDVQDVKINVTNDDTTDGDSWISLEGIHPGIYNLLDLVNDKDTLLAGADIPGGRVHQLRLILGEDNSVVIDGQSYALKTPSAQQSGLKLNIQQDVVGGVAYTILLDFDVARSIVETGNGKYILKPVIRTILQADGGSIRGVVMPDTVRTAVIALQGLDTVASTFTNLTGDYLIKGLDAGSYDLHFLPADTSYMMAAMTGVMVEEGKLTTVDTVVLEQ